MVSSVAAGSGGTHRPIDSGGSQSRIDSLLAQIDTLRKRIVTLQKQLADTEAPSEREKLSKQIIDILHMMQLLEQQMAQIQFNEQQKARVRQQAQHDMAQEKQARDKKT